MSIFTYTPDELLGRTTEVQAQNPYLHLFFNYADSSK